MAESNAGTLLPFFVWTCRREDATSSFTRSKLLAIFFLSPTSPPPLPASLPAEVSCASAAAAAAAHSEPPLLPVAAEGPDGRLVIA